MYGHPDNARVELYIKKTPCIFKKKESILHSGMKEKTKSNYTSGGNIDCSLLHAVLCPIGTSDASNVSFFTLVTRKGLRFRFMCQ